MLLANSFIEGSRLLSETEHYELRLVEEGKRELDNGVSGLFINYLLVRKDNMCIELWGGMLGFMENQLELIQLSHTHALAKKKELLSGNVISIGNRRSISLGGEFEDQPPPTIN